MSSFIWNPLFINFFIKSWENPHNFSTSRISLNRTAKSIKHISCVEGFKFPRSWSERIRLFFLKVNFPMKRGIKKHINSAYSTCKSTNWAKINNIARQFRIECSLNVSSNFSSFASSCFAELFNTCNLGRESKILFISNEISEFLRKINQNLRD